MRRTLPLALAALLCLGAAPTLADEDTAKTIDRAFASMDPDQLMVTHYLTDPDTACRKYAHLSIAWIHLVAVAYLDNTPDAVIQAITTTAQHLSDDLTELRPQCVQET